MINLKLTACGAIFGFVLSILGGLVGGIPVSTMFLRAAFSAVLLGGLMAFISMIYKKFLSESTDTIVDHSESSVGNHVDLTIDDEILPDSSNAPDFFVEHKMNNKVSFKTNKQEQENVSIKTEAESDVFIPKPLVGNGIVSSDDKVYNNSDIVEDSLDVLPDLDNLISDKDQKVQEINTDSTFARSGPDVSKSDGNVDVGTDTSVMAQAISTLLKREG